MGPSLLILRLLAVALPAAAQQPSDTLIFDTPATRAVVERAAVRHRAQDSLVADYQATLRYRLTFSIGQRRWARIPPTAVEEQEAVVQWQRPNDLRVDFLGRRARTRSGDGTLNSSFGTPWFVPRGLGDSVRIFADDFPERAALHPLAADGAAWYRYRMGDSVSISLPSGEQLTLLMVEFVPRQVGPALIVGRMWLDGATAEVVRLAFRYVGTDLWTVPDGETRRDTTQSRRANAIINRILSISGDLEYARQDGRYWMPYRQVISGRVQVPLVSDLVFPFEAITTFSDYAINTGAVVTFTIPVDTTRLTRAQREARRDSLQRERRDERNVPDPDQARTWSGRMEGGGRFEMRRPPLDSMRAYSQWGDSLAFDLSAAEARRVRESLADLERLASRLPGSLTGRPGSALAVERLADLVRFNRVQGLSLGMGYQWWIPGRPFTQMVGTTRYGFSDHRLNVRLSVVHDAPGGRFTVSGFREVVGTNPLALGGELANTWRGIVSARDENDYLLATGGRASFETSLAMGTEFMVWAGYEQQDEVTRRARSAINDWLGGTGEFLPNGPVTTGGFAVAGIRLDHGFSGRTRWILATDGRAGDGRAVARGWTRLEHRFGGSTAPRVRASIGAATRATADQMGFQAGAGRTVRGHAHAAQRGQAFWSLQVDVPTGRRWFHPVFFVDAGQAGHLAGESSLGDRPVLVGAGVGFKLLGGLIGVDHAEPITVRP